MKSASVDISDYTAWCDAMRRELEDNILPYWSDKMIDEAQGGFYGRRDGFDQLEKGAPKGIILNTRILWTFSQAARLYPSPTYRAIADRAYQYISRHFVDPQQGGVFWMVDSAGHPLSTKKQVYAQAFAIYAWTEYYRLTGLEESLTYARQLYALLEQHSFDPAQGGYLEAFDRDWQLLDDLRLSTKDANEKKTMNTHLHVLEAYTNLYRCWPDAGLQAQLRNLIVVFRDKIINPQGHFDLFFDEQWQVRSHEISFGHDIEGSWLLCEAADVLGDPMLLHEIQQLALVLVDKTIAEGLDHDGGLMHEANARGVCDTDKHWWPQAEALVGLVNAWQISGRTHYLVLARKVWEFIGRHLIDREQGEWFWRVNRFGQVNRDEDKAGPWKCPYHNGRALLELLQRL